jgi:DNA-binding response OmpR family regulator
MPRVDGSQVAAGIKRASPSTPVILLTGWGARMDNGEESRPNVDVILGKPPTLAQLREALSSVCRRPPQAG